MTNQEAIEVLSGILAEAIEFENSVCYVTGEDREPLEMAIEALKNQKTGHWILKRTFPTKLYEEYLNEYECSECYRKIRCTESQLINYPYCHCGAKMEGEYTMKYKAIVEYEYPCEHKPPVKADIYLHGDKVSTRKITPINKGRWERKEEQFYGDNYYVCSKCGESYDIGGANINDFKYCPNCGAEMGEI